MSSLTLYDAKAKGLFDDRLKMVDPKLIKISWSYIFSPTRAKGRRLCDDRHKVMDLILIGCFRRGRFCLSLT